MTGGPRDSAIPPAPNTSGGARRPDRGPAGRWTADAAFAWSLLFIVPHVYWAVGGTAGLEGERIDGALRAINYAAIALSVVAAALALALGRRWGRSLPRRALLIGAWCACVVLSLRGGAGLIQDLVFVLDGSGGDVSTLFLVFEPLFLVGGILFGLAARNYGAARPRT